MVARAEIVVRASVAGVAREPAKVRAALKGPPSATLMFAQQRLASDKIYEGWRDAGREHLWFLGREEAHGQDANPGIAAAYPLRVRDIVRLGPPVPAERGFKPPP